MKTSKSKKLSSFAEEKVHELEDVDDWSSAWKECQAAGEKWGGRGRGGRAANRMTVQTKDVVIEGCTLSYLNNDLLQRTTLRLIHNHRYGLIGRNGVGKSTLMSRIATGTLPGMPGHIRVAQVLQELPDVVDEGALKMNPVDYIIANDPVRKQIMKQIDFLEQNEIDGEQNNELFEEQAELLGDLYDALDDDANMCSRTIRVLKELGFDEEKRSALVSTLSGGWRMRIAIASAIVQQPNLLLLDEPTNHLDLEGVEWLISYLTSPSTNDMIVLVTSHDQSFLDAVCTDIIRFHRQTLKYYPGNYTDYLIAYQDKELHNLRTQENIDKKRDRLEESIKRQQAIAAKSTASSNAVSNLKHKLERHGAEKNEKGFRFRVQQDSYHGMSATRLGSHTEVALGRKTGESRSLTDAIEREWTMTLPEPQHLSTCGPYLQLRGVTVGYCGGPKLVGNAPNYKDEVDLPLAVLRNVTIDISRTSKIAIIGRNGCGKSTIMKLIDVCKDNRTTTVVKQNGPIIIEGEVSINPNLKIAYFQQHQEDHLPLDFSPLEYLTDFCNPQIKDPTKVPNSFLMNYNEQTLRAHLGAFGLTGDLALRRIGLLSGGQKARVVLSQLTLNKPQLLLMDEPTNNLDLDGIKALSKALKEFQGASIVASHDMSFVANTCDVVYCVRKNGEVKIMEGGVEEYKSLVREQVRKKKQSIR